MHKVFQSPVARAVPFDTTGNYLSKTNVQEVIEEVKGANVVIVNPTGTGTIAAAIAAITTATSTNQFIIKLNPGTYIEPQLVMKNFVSIVGIDTQATIITPVDPTDHLIIGAAATLRFLTIKGVTTAGKAGIYSNASGLQVRNCVIRDNPINIYVEGIASLASITADTNIITGVFDTGIWLKNAGAGVSGVFTNSIFNAASANSGAKCSISEGASVSFIFSSLIANGTAATNCLTVKDGATLKVLADEIKGFAKAIWVENVGAAPIIDILSANLDSNTVDIQIDHTSAIGVIHGIITRSKVINSALNGVQLNYTDPVNGDFNITRILATRGFAPELSALTTIAGTTQLLSTDPFVTYVSGSTVGHIVQLPDATTLRVGHQMVIINAASVPITTQQYGGSSPIQVSSDYLAHYYLRDNSSSAGVWHVSIVEASSSTSSSSYRLKMQSTFYYDSSTHGLNSGVFVTTDRLKDVIHLCPIHFPEQITLDRIGLENTTATSGALARVGIYNDSNGLPSSLLLDAGEFSIAATGIKQVTINQIVSAGWYWLAFNYTSSGTSRTFRAFSLDEGFSLGYPSSPTSDKLQRLEFPSTYGALPSSLAITSTHFATGRTVRVFVRRA